MPAPLRIFAARRLVRSVLLLSAWLLVLPACQSAKLQNAQQAYRVGDLDRARATIDRFVKKEKQGNTALLGRLEQAAVYRSQGDFRASNRSLAAANQLLLDIDQRPDVSLSRETLAALTNLGTLPYRGTGYDRIMLHTYAALNHLSLGRADRARVDLRRALERQREAVAQNARQLARVREDSTARDADAPRYDADRATRDPRFRAGLGQAYAPLDQYRVYGNYVNPFTEWLQALYFRGVAVDGNDLEASRKSFERVAGMAPGNDYASQDFADAQDIAAGGEITPTTYVVLATGTAPTRGEVRIDIPLWIFGGQIDYVGANFPRLVPNPVYLHGLSVQTPTGRYPTQLLCDMDAVVAEDFKNQLPATITKTLVAAGTKAAVAYSLRRAAERQDTEIALLVRLFTTIYQYAANQADLRTWASLPKQYQIARFPTPYETPPAGDLEADTVARPSTITLTAPGQPVRRVRLQPGRINVVLVRSITPYRPWQVTQFTLDPLAPLGDPAWSAAPPEPLDATP